MNPNDSVAPQSTPAPQSQVSDQASQHVVPAGNVPVFHNPLAQSYENGTAQLPPIEPISQPEPTNVNPIPTPVPQSVSFQSPQPVQTPPAPVQPTVDELTNLPIKPAPVRLAAVPRSDDAHAGGLQASSQTIPFGGTPVNTVAPSVQAVPTPTPNVAKRKPIGLIVGIASGLVVLLIAAIGGYVFFTSKKTITPTATPVVVGSVRDKTEKPTQPFSEKISTDCYMAQSLTPVEIQQNKDCALSITYGEQKISSIFVSALGQFDIATDSSSGSTTQNNVQGIDTKKYLEALIVNIIPKDLVTTREDIKVGGLSAVKVVGKKDAASAVDVAYVFIILPEGDRTFGEKDFVAFIVTGAYNDDYSRKGFDQFLSTWSWK